MHRPLLSPILIITAALIMLSACEKAHPPKPSAAASPKAKAPANKTAAPQKPKPKEALPPMAPTRWPSNPARVIAIGDVHGDLQATLAALRLAGAIAPDGQSWIGKDLVVVQTGDQLDRGDDEMAILDLFDRLHTEAKAAGGAFIPLNGNHEIMNIQGDMRYITPGSLPPFDAMADQLDLNNPAVQRYPEALRRRVAAFMPGGPLARRLARRNIVGIVGRTAFVHGGLHPEHAAYGLDRINKEARDWANGDAPMPAILQGNQSPIWSRRFSDEAQESDCALLEQTLVALDIDRLILGHTVQKHGVTSACDGKVWRIDVGMAAHYGGKAQVLEIVGDQVKVIAQK